MSPQADPQSSTSHHQQYTPSSESATSNTNMEIESENDHRGCCPPSDANADAAAAHGVARSQASAAGHQYDTSMDTQTDNTYEQYDNPPPAEQQYASPQNYSSASSTAHGSSTGDDENLQQAEAEEHANANTTDTSGELPHAPPPPPPPPPPPDVSVQAYGGVLTYDPTNPFACVACNKSFSSVSRLRAHQTVHSDNRPHVCPTCSKRMFFVHFIPHNNLFRVERQQRVCVYTYAVALSPANI